MVNLYNKYYIKTYFIRQILRARNASNITAFLLSRDDLIELSTRRY